MTYEEMKRVVKLQWKEVLKTRDAGQKEYARTEDNVFANFERVAKKLSNPANRTDIPSDDPIFSRITRENVLLVYLLKHIDGICAHVDGHTSQREDVTGRITDAIVYLCLLRGMIEDGKNRTKGNIVRSV